MALDVNFPEKYANLICTDIQKMQPQSEPCTPKIPDKYQKKLIHPENGFVKLFCEEYD